MQLIFQFTRKKVKWSKIYNSLLIIVLSKEKYVSAKYLRFLPNENSGHSRTLDGSISLWLLGWRAQTNRHELNCQPCRCSRSGEEVSRWWLTSPWRYLKRILFCSSFGVKFYCFWRGALLELLFQFNNTSW